MYTIWLSVMTLSPAAPLRRRGAGGLRAREAQRLRISLIMR